MSKNISFVWSGEGMPTLKLLKRHGVDLVRMNELLKQVTPEGEPITKSTLYEFDMAENRIVLVFCGKLLIGFATLVRQCKINCSAANMPVRLEHVIIDSAYRGKGIGVTLGQELIRFALGRLYTRIDLTSEPARLAANRLYRSLGFKRRKTNVYRLKIMS